MFETTATTDLLRQVRAHDFDNDDILETGHQRIDAIRELDRAIAAAQAEQLTHIAALHTERIELMGLGPGDPSLSVIGEIAVARNIGPPPPAPNSASL